MVTERITLLARRGHLSFGAVKRPNLLLLLGETEDLLLRAMIKQKLAIPSIIYDDRVEQPPENCQSTTSGVAQTEQVQTTSKRRRSGELHKKGSRGTVPEKLYEEALAKVQSLKLKVKSLKLQLNEERSHSRKMENVLLSRLEAESSTRTSHHMARSCLADGSLSRLDVPDCLAHVGPASHARTWSPSKDAGGLDCDDCSSEELCQDPFALEVSGELPEVSGGLPHESVVAAPPPGPVAVVPSPCPVAVVQSPRPVAVVPPPRLMAPRPVTVVTPPRRAAPLPPPRPKTALPPPRPVAALLPPATMAVVPPPRLVAVMSPPRPVAVVTPPCPVAALPPTRPVAALPSPPRPVAIKPPPLVAGAVGDNDQVDLGDGLFMMAAQFNHCVKKSATDSKMVRNTALSLWTHEELLVRSVTGNPSRRFLKECPEGTKQPMTPKKLKIVRAALRAYIGNRPKEEVDARLAKTNTYLATYVQDTCTRWKRAQLKKGQEAAAEAEEMELLSILSPLQHPTSPSGTAE